MASVNRLTCLHGLSAGRYTHAGHPHPVSVVPYRMNGGGVGGVGIVSFPML